MSEMVDTYNVAEWILKRHQLEEELTTLRADNKRMAEELEAWRRSKIAVAGEGKVMNLLTLELSTIEAAVDALMAEREE